MGIYESPTKRYGPKVQDAGIDRNPTVRPGGVKFVCGYVWVTLSTLVRHRLWVTIGLPVLAKMYFRARDICIVPGDYELRFKKA
ncbi:unnamed protein product [marine sediment metagenome]|uniref:Uncharacterized protein n=1 Tax=marine sediment metagenome TaxID=412755 RepID=X1FAZ6_9ZZZZ